jgi:transposase
MEKREGVTVMQLMVTSQQRQAARLELVKQIEQGVSVREARMSSAISMHRTTVYLLLKRVRSEGERALIERRHGHPIKFRGEILVLVCEHCQVNPCVSSSTVQRLLQERFRVSVSVSQLNRVRAACGLTRMPAPREKNYGGNLSLLSFPLRSPSLFPP